MQVRASKYDVNEEEIKPYFSLDRMCEAIFDCAHRLFQLRFERRADIPTYHPDVVAYEVFRETDSGDQLVGVFLHGKSQSRDHCILSPRAGCACIRNITFTCYDHYRQLLSEVQAERRVDERVPRAVPQRGGGGCCWASERGAHRSQ